MSFFITSTNPGKGGDLGGLAGADRYCQSLAASVGAGNKTWRAYLSNAALNGQPAFNARDRIGNGPWRNAKGVVIGCASAGMITKNHSQLQHSRAFAGNIENNPVRDDLNEAGILAGVRMAVNVVMTPDKKIAALYVGDPCALLNTLAEKTRKLYGFKLARNWDIVVASCGGAPPWRSAAPAPWPC